MRAKHSLLDYTDFSQDLLESDFLTGHINSITKVSKKKDLSLGKIIYSVSHLYTKDVELSPEKISIKFLIVTVCPEGQRTGVG